MNIQGWFPLGWTCLTSLESKGLLRVFFKAQFKDIKYINKIVQFLKKEVKREGHLHQGVSGSKSEPKQYLTGTPDRTVQVWAQSPRNPPWKTKPKVHAWSPGGVNVQGYRALQSPDPQGQHSTLESTRKPVEGMPSGVQCSGGIFWTPLSGEGKSESRKKVCREYPFHCHAS